MSAEKGKRTGRAWTETRGTTEETRHVYLCYRNSDGTITKIQCQGDKLYGADDRASCQSHHTI